jgi:predicted membrane protein
VTGRHPETPSFFNGWLPRLVSFLLAVGVLLLVMAVPQVWARGVAMGYLPLVALLWGLGAGFTHGLGYVPARPLPRVLLGPGPAWLLLIGGLLWILILAGPLPGRGG